MAQGEYLFLCLFFLLWKKKIDLYSLSYHIELKTKKTQDKKLANCRILQIFHCDFLSQTVLLTWYPWLYDHLQLKNQHFNSIHVQNIFVYHFSIYGCGLNSMMFTSSSITWICVSSLFCSSQLRDSVLIRFIRVNRRSSSAIMLWHVIRFYILF